MYLSTDNVLDGNDQLLQDSPSGAILPGQPLYYYFTPVIPASTPPGNYFLIVSIDDSDDIAELDETNNTAATVMFEVTAPDIDFSIENASLSGGIIDPTSSVDLDGDLVNNGNTDADTGIIAVYFSSDETLDMGADFHITTISIPGVPAGGIFTGFSEILDNIPGSVPSGDYFVLLAADPDDIIMESDETNNEANAGLVTYHAPEVDLSVSDVFSAEAEVTTSIEVSATITNNGI